MAFAEQAKVRMALTGSESDTTFDTLIGEKMTEADNEIADMLYMAAQKWGKKQALPAVDITNGYIGGVSVPQNIKDAASNLAAALCYLMMKQYDTHNIYKAMAQQTVDGYIQRLAYDQEVFLGFF